MLTLFKFMKGSKMSRRDKRKNKGSKSIFFLLIFLIFFVYSGYKIIEWYMENKQNNTLIEEISNTVKIVETDQDNPKYEIDFKRLKEKNKQTVAWLKVSGTNIETPVVQAKNNEYYLNHSLDEKRNSAGWVFADYRNKFDGTDKNTVIYGHNRRDGSMFGTLKNILKEEWYNNSENLTINFITENNNMHFQVFSVYSIESEDYYIKTDFKNDDEYEKFIKDITKRSIKDFEEEVTEKNKILTLSTCANNNKYRVVLHAYAK